MRLLKPVFWILRRIHHCRMTPLLESQSTLQRWKLQLPVRVLRCLATTAATSVISLRSTLVSKFIGPTVRFTLEERLAVSGSQSASYVVAMDICIGIVQPKSRSCFQAQPFQICRVDATSAHSVVKNRDQI